MLTCTVENAPLFLDWIQNRGGLAVWRSLDLSNPGASWTTPALTKDGQPMTKPTWQVGNNPEEIVTDAAAVVIDIPKEVSRFRVAVKMQNMNLRVSDGGTRKIKAAVAKAGENAWYEFDYANQEAVIFVPEKSIKLSEWTK